MRTLYLLRHAKSSWDDPKLKDHDRPLAERGRKAAPQMGAFIRAGGLRPQRVLCSSAVRARQTWELVAPELVPVPEVEVRRDLYEADAHKLLDVLRQVDGAAERVLMIGHNPALERFAAALAGPDSDADALATMRSKYPTAALAEIAFDAETWAEVTPGQGRLLRFVRPKDL